MTYLPLIYKITLVLAQYWWNVEPGDGRETTAKAVVQPSEGLSPNKSLSFARVRVVSCVHGCNLRACSISMVNNMSCKILDKKNAWINWLNLHYDFKERARLMTIK